MNPSDIQQIEAPVFVEENEACSYRKQGYEDFDGEGWYVEVKVRIKESTHGSYDIGSLQMRYLGPFDTYKEASLKVATLVPGVLVVL